MPSVNATNYDNIPAYVPKEKNHVYAVIETPAGTRHKYAFEPKFGIMELKTTLPEGLAWPYDYGFVPETLADDGDPLDVLVLNDEPTFSGCLIQVRVLGGFKLAKNGIENDRLVACPVSKPGVSLKTDIYEKLSDVPDEMLEGIQRFLVEYSEEQGNRIEFRGRCGRKSAYDLIDCTRKAFRKKK